MSLLLGGIYLASSKFKMDITNAGVEKAWA